MCRLIFSTRVGPRPGRRPESTRISFPEAAWPYRRVGVLVRLHDRTVEGRAGEEAPRDRDQVCA